MAQVLEKNSLKRFMTFIKPERRYFYLLAICSLIGNGMITGMPYIMGVGIDRLLNLIRGEGGSSLTYPVIQEALLGPVVILLALGVIGAVFSYVQEWLMAKLSETISLRLRQEVTRKFKVLPMSFFDQHQVGDVLSRTTNDINRIAEVLLTGINQLFSAIVSIVFGVSMLVYLNLQLTGLILVLMLVATFVTGKVANLNKSFADRNQSELGILNNQIEEFLSGNLEVKTFNQQAATAGIIEETNKRHRQAFQNSQFIEYAIYPAMRVLNQFAFIISALIGATLVISGGMTIGILQAYLQYVNQISEPITTFSYVINGIQSAMASYERVLVILDHPEEKAETQSPAILKQPQGRIVFDHVRFGYTPEKILMEDVNFVADPQQMIAVVGPTGAGKTTLVNLLMRFYEINGGTISFDGIDISQLTRKNLREMFGMVLQDTWLFEGTVAENIAYGKKDATRAEIIAAAKVAQCDYFIRTLPEGYDTVISSENSSLSQGQQQLLTIARVILANPPVVILDEATSSVDTRTEMDIQVGMSKITENRTSFVIAHRLSTIEKADLILVMEAGTIVEQGTHQQLLARQGLYAQLHQSQFKE